MADQGTPRTELWPSDLTLQLLGPVRLIGSNGEDRTPKSRKTRAVLALLALARGPLSRARLADLLWGDRGEDQAKASLRQALYEVRHLSAGGYVRAERETVSLGPRLLATDVGDVARLMAAGDAAALADALERSDEPFLSTIDDLTPELDEWLRAERARLAETILAGGIKAGAAALDRGDANTARRLADSLARIDPLSEAAARLGIEADLKLGDRSSAARRHDRLRHQMREDLGIEPAPDIAQLLAGGVPAPAHARAEAPTPDAPEALPRPAFRRWWPALAVLLLFAVAAFAWWQTTRPAAAAAPTVAVLPFQQRGQSEAYFASGVSDEILNLLSNQNQVRVLGRISAEQIGGAGSALQTAERLGITHLLDGSVMTDGGKVLVIARLTRVSDGAQLWSERYERRAGDIFKVQGDIAGAVAARLARSFGPTPPARATSPAVYDRYLAARQLLRDRREMTLLEAERLLREAVRRDPAYAPALAELSQVIMLLADHPVSYGKIPIAEAQREAEALARRAIAIDPNLGDAYAALGFITLRDASAEALFRKAVALSPQRSEFRRWHGQSLVDSNRFDEAVDVYRSAVEIDPLWGLNYDHLVGTYILLGRQDEASAMVKRFLSLSADDRAKRLLVLSMTRSEFRHADAYRQAAALYRDYPDERQMRFNFATAAAQIGELGPALDAIRQDELGAAVLRKDWPGLARAAERLGPHFWDVGQFWDASSRLVEAGRGDVLVRLYNQSRERMANDRAFAKDVAQPATIVALRQAAMKVEAERLLSLYRARVTTFPNKGQIRLDRDFGRMVIAAMTGDRAGALTLADRLSREQPLFLTRVPGRSLLREPALASIADDPRFAIVDERVRAAVNRERAKVGLKPLSIVEWRTSS